VDAELLLLSEEERAKKLETLASKEARRFEKEIGDEAQKLEHLLGKDAERMERLFGTDAKKMENLIGNDARKMENEAAAEARHLEQVFETHMHLHGRHHSKAFYKKDDHHKLSSHVHYVHAGTHRSSSEPPIAGRIIEDDRLQYVTKWDKASRKMRYINKITRAAAWTLPAGGTVVEEDANDADLCAVSRFGRERANRSRHHQRLEKELLEARGEPPVALPLQESIEHPSTAAPPPGKHCMAQRQAHHHRHHSEHHDHSQNHGHHAFHLGAETICKVGSSLQMFEGNIENDLHRTGSHRRRGGHSGRHAGSHI
jgi:hypothetical protein